jgi:hypothetical protein
MRREDLGFAIAIDDGNRDEEHMTYLCSTEAPAPDYHYEETRDLTFIKGGVEAKEDRVFSVYGTDRQRVMVTENVAMAVGSYLHLLDTHRIDEREAHRKLYELATEQYQEYVRVMKNQTLRDRRISLLDQAEADSEHHPFYTPILGKENGEWRNKGLTPEEKHRVQRYIEREEPNPRFCYKNCRNALEEWWEDDRVTYVEGIAIPKEGLRIMGHAWIEIEEKVAELTLPWNTPDPEGTGAVYFGSEVPRERFKNLTGDVDEGEDPGPLLLDSAGDKVG